MGGVPPDDYADDSTIDPLPEDNDTPFSPADPVADEPGGSHQDPAGGSAGISSTHPVTDTNIQPEEVYEEKLSGAAEAAEPNKPDNVISYDPDKDERRDQAA
jgi:hypothetical protein